MALCRTGPYPILESNVLAYSHINLSTRLVLPVPLRFAGQSSNAGKRKHKVICSSSLRRSASASSMESHEEVPKTSSVCMEEETDHVMRFKMSDFKVLDRVSIGLGGRADEVVFEGKVKDSVSPLYNTRVILRQLYSSQAQRRGKRAIEVLKKLGRRKLLYHSYSMQVHGYISLPASGGSGSFILVHGYHGSFSLRHWLQQSDWLQTLEATLALDEESVRKVGEDTTGGPAISRQLRLIRILMRDLLIGVNYLHSHGLAHTELRLENVHISPIDRHIKVGTLGNAADFCEDGSNRGSMENMDRRQMMIAFDMRCMGFIMAKMVMGELMDPLIFAKFKSFLTKGNDPSCLRQLMMEILGRNSPYGNAGLQMLDRNWGAGWHLLSLLLATKPSRRISCLDALRHPFLCGPRWRVVPSMDIIRWGLGCTAMRISEEYIYRQPQRSRLAHFIDLLEMLNPHPKPKNWLELLPGKWRLLYCTGRHVGLTLRQPPVRVLVGDLHLTVSRESKLKANLSFVSDIGFSVMIGQDWPHDKAGKRGRVQVNSSFILRAGRRLYLKQDNTSERLSFRPSGNEEALAQKFSSKKWRKITPFKEFPSSLPAAKFASGDIDVTMNLDDPLDKNIDTVQNVLQELRTQIPQKLNLPSLPTTTIGSFPQTADLRRVRREFKANKISEEDYIRFIKEEINNVIKIQEELDIDVLVHGEPERNDMVEYFGEQLSGFAFTANGWVQSYGSRCVKPPIIFGDVSRPKPMTVFWSSTAQSLTKRPMKGMLTGPVTILNWSFVRDDQPRFETCYQIALAIKDEVEDLEKAGITVIQIDEAALREGLPLRKSEESFYLNWAVHSFRITNCGVQDTTQIHTHMCYSNFNDIIHSIIDMDADVITIENSRSDEKLLSVFREGVKYGAGIGPGVYDIHSPRIPPTEEIADRINKMLAVLESNILWVNPDCGLKTRKYTEVKPALTNMVDAAKLIRKQLASSK